MDGEIKWVAAPPPNVPVTITLTHAGLGRWRISNNRGTLPFVVEPGDVVTTTVTLDANVGLETFTLPPEKLTLRFIGKPQTVGQRVRRRWLLLTGPIRRILAHG